MKIGRIAGVLSVGTLILAACTSAEPPLVTPTVTDTVTPTVTEPGSRNGEIPAFSNPITITNPYLPFDQRGRWIYEGTKEGDPYLIEVAVTHETRTIEWGDNATETMVVRHRGWVGGVLIEEALDYFAQGDDGSVWYFGEDVDNYDQEGAFVDHDGAWLAGVDGANPGMLMPGDPRVGQVFYSEDVTGQDIVERDEILSLSEPAETPEGPVDYGLLLGATQPDGTEEEKIFVPDVGEVLARSDEGQVRLVRRLPQDAESATEVAFSEPAVVDNPYFGVTGVDFRLYLGEDEGEPLRIDTALTGETKPITWAGGRTETVVSQFIATSDRNLLEIAVDWFGQDDTGGVWYFGEDVFNYEDGRVANTDGTWIAAGEVPPGLIMPGDPALGQRFNPENIPAEGIFETVEVQAVDETYTLPNGGRLNGMLQLHETLADGVEETKLYASGYGNVHVETPGVEVVGIVYALPNDAVDAPLPGELGTMLEELRALSVEGMGGTDRLRSSLEAFTARGDAVPAILVELAGTQLDGLDGALAGADAGEARMAALDLEQTILDLARLYLTDRPVDLDVLDLHARRMLAAVDADDMVAAATGAALARGVAERNVTTLSGEAFEAAVATDAAAEEGDLAGIAEAASALRSSLSTGR